VYQACAINKAVPFVLVAIMACTASVRSQVMDAATIREPVVPVASPTTACILGDLPDGTPPPQQPKPNFVVAAKDILTTATQQQGGRSITIRRIKPIALPPPAESAPVQMALDQALLEEDLAAPGVQLPKWDFLFLGATVFRGERAQLQREAELKANPPRPKNITLNYWRTERPAPAKGGAK
jgi:hypothetical protein